jgi:hypothetical protein
MKGLTKVLEVALSIIMILVIYVTVFSSSTAIPDFESINIQLKAINSLQNLDQNNELRSLVLQNDTATISNELAPLLPANINYLVNICGISCTAPIINSTRTFSVSYIVSGDIGNYNPKQVIVYMWSS